MVTKLFNDMVRTQIRISLDIRTSWVILILNVNVTIYWTVLVQTLRRKVTTTSSDLDRRGSLLIPIMTATIHPVRNFHFCAFNSLALKCNLRTHVPGYIHEQFLWNRSQMNATEHPWWYVNIGSINLPTRIDHCSLWHHGDMPHKTLPICDCIADVQWKAKSEYTITQHVLVSFSMTAISNWLTVESFISPTPLMDTFIKTLQSQNKHNA